jgi:hypothetical protein
MSNRLRLHQFTGKAELRLVGQPVKIKPVHLDRV